MSEPADRSETARLDELAAVTKEYAHFSGPGAGLALTAIGCWLLGAQWVLSDSPRLGAFLFLFAPFLWVALASIARAYYQRHGEVIGSSRADLNVRSAPFRSTMLFIVFVAVFRGISGLLDAPGGEFESLALAAYLGMAMLAVGLVRTRPWIAYLYWAVTTLATLTGPVGGRAEPRWHAWARIAFAVTALVAGILSHLRYRRLERRLVALKGGA